MALRDNYPCILIFVRFANDMDSQDSEAMILSGIGTYKCFSKYFHPKFKTVNEALTWAQMHQIPRSRYALAV